MTVVSTNTSIKRLFSIWIAHNERKSCTPRYCKLPNMDCVESLSHIGFSVPSRSIISHIVLKPLPLRPAPNHKETIPSFLSRIAAMNRLCSTDFAVDMGFSLKRILYLEDNALRRLAECGGLTNLQLEELVSWTGRGIGNVRMIFREEIFVSRALRKPIIRGCPVCLREDIEADYARPLTQMTMRGDWQLREISLCVKHRHPLVPLWERSRLDNRYDLSLRFAEILPDILEGKLERPQVTPSPYDYWLNTRLNNGADETWLADQSLYAATTFCTLLGTELLRLRTPSKLDEETQLRLAQAMGFSVARHGEASIREALNELAALADGHNDEPKKAFGQLFIDLSRAHLDKDDFTTFRKILRDCIVDIWPVASGEIVLGIVQPERQLHSIRTAARETNIGPFLLEQFLIHSGALAANDVRPTSRKTFDAEAYSGLLEEIPTLVGPTEMERVMGATKRQLASLAEDGLLAPRINIPTIKSPWRASDGIAFVAELQEMAVSIEPTDKLWEGIQQAKNRTGLRVGTIISAVRDGTLQVGRRTNIEGYTGLCVLKIEINAMRPVNISNPDIALITAAAFGRSVGIRTQGWFEGLLDANHTPATRTTDPKLGKEKVYLSTGDIDCFHKRFLTAATMETEFGQHRRTLLAKLKAAKVNAFAPNGEDFGPLYLREDVEAVLR